MKSFSQFINKAGSLDQIRRSARQLESLAKRIRAVLPDDAATHMVGCALQPGTVVVFCDNAVWAAQLRYSQPTILDACQQTFGTEIRRVQFKILPPEPLAGKPPAPELTENSRRLLEQAANGIADDNLAEALRRLSSNNTDQDAE